MHPGNGLSPLLIRPKLGEPAIGQLGHPAQDPFRRNGAKSPTSTHPYWYGTLYRQRVYTSMDHLMPPALEVNYLLGPKAPQKGNLLFAAPPPVVKILA